MALTNAPSTLQENLPTTYKTTAEAMNNNTSRRPLGEITPNARRFINQVPNGSGKPLQSSSPLKRNIAQVLNNDRGLMYLKRRKLSDTSRAMEAADSRPVVAPRGPDTLSPEIASRQQVDGDVPDVDVNSDDTVVDPARGTATRDLSSTEEDTPSDAEDGRDSQQSSATRHSFSSLINYDPSSQQRISGRDQSKHDNRHIFGSLADILRLRLQIAMYKVRTNQVYTPFEQLRLQRGIRHAIENRELSRSPSPSSSEDSPELPTIQSVRRAAAALDHGVPKLLPAPVLLPTAHSSRMISMPKQSSGGRLASPIDLGSLHGRMRPLAQGASVMSSPYGPAGLALPTDGVAEPASV